MPEQTVGDTYDILLVEDNPADARLFEELLADGELAASYRWETSLEEGLKAAADQRPSVIVVDLGLPDSEGTETVARVRERLPDRPLVVLTGRSGLDTAAAALDAGASEYLRKDDLTPPLLARTLRLAVERRRLEQRAEEQRARSYSILNSLSEHVAVIDPDGTIVAVNDAWQAFAAEEAGDPTGYAGDNYLAATRGAAEQGSTDAQRMLSGLEAVLAGDEEGFSMEYPCHGPDEKRWFMVQVVPLAGAREGGAVVSHLDITERKLAEMELKRSEVRHRTLVETMNEATMILDGEGRITFANAAAEQMLGLEQSELAERTYDDPAWTITAPDGSPFPTSELPFRQVMETGEPVRHVEHAITRPDGTRTILSVNAAPMGTGTGGLERVVATMRDVTEQKRLESRLEHEALHDPLTGLANRTLFEDRLRQALARSRRQGEPMGLLMIDVDHFKRVNDELGHTVGDQVLTELARRLEETVREEDTVARWGGDEFVVVLPELSEPGAVSGVWKRIQAAVQPPIEVGGQSIQMDLTAGSVVHADEDHPRTIQARDPEELTRFASLALHWAKEDAPGGFDFYDRARMAQEDAAPIQREGELRDALERDEILPYYQPIVRLDDRSRVSMEALARWRHPEEGVLGPGEFIPLTETLGLVGPLQEAVVRQGCRDLAAWQETSEAGAGLKIRFNISGQHFRAPTLAEDLEQTVREAGARPEQVIVEVTETSLMRVPATVDALRGVGFEISIDDFGTGYSTLTYLRDLDVDELKIDMTFTQGIVDSPSDMALVDTILTLGDRLGLRVVAEGIETEGQLRRLRSIGCTYGQGFLFGRPAPADQIEELREAESPA